MDEIVVSGLLYVTAEPTGMIKIKVPDFGSSEDDPTLITLTARAAEELADMLTRKAEFARSLG